MLEQSESTQRVAELQIKFDINSLLDEGSNLISSQYIQKRISVTSLLIRCYKFLNFRNYTTYWGKSRSVRRVLFMMCIIKIVAESDMGLDETSE